MKTSIIATALIGITAVAVYVYPNAKANPSPQPEPIITTQMPAPSVITPITASHSQQKKIEVVFVLDTTGSMSGLIQAAKDNIWSIASSMASAESSPIIKMGLVAYRDRGDDYVTKVVDLSEDLDTNYGTLMGFQAGGGGDTPESVNKGLYDAVTDMSWSTDDDTYRVIFLVGDAPPQTRYRNEMQYPEIIKLAQDKGIIINTIQCGNHTETAAPWKQIARLSQGDYFQVTQSGGAVAVKTPYDEQIATLSRELDETRLFFGNRAEKEAKRKKTDATRIFNRSASASSIARKAEFNTSESGKSNFADEQELVEAVSSGRVELDSIAKEELPEELQSLDQAAQRQVLKQKAQKRQALQEEIALLGRQRSDYVAAELKKTGLDKDSIDNKIYQTVREQGAEKGLVYSSEAAKY